MQFHRLWRLILSQLKFQSTNISNIICIHFDKDRTKLETDQFLINEVIWANFESDYIEVDTAGILGINRLSLQLTKMINNV